MEPHESKYARLVPPLVIDPVIAEAIGLNESIIVQQFLYWLARSKNRRDGRRWIYNSYKEWQEQFPFWSVSTIKRIIYGLEEKGIVLSTDKYNKMPTDRTKWYTVCADKLDALVEPFAERVKMVRSTYQDDTLDCANLIRCNQRLPENTQRKGATRPALIEGAYSDRLER